MNGWIDGWMGGWMDGWIETSIILTIFRNPFYPTTLLLLLQNPFLVKQSLPPCETLPSTALFCTTVLSVRLMLPPPPPPRLPLFSPVGQHR